MASALELIRQVVGAAQGHPSRRAQKKAINEALVANQILSPLDRRRSPSRRVDPCVLLHEYETLLPRLREILGARGTREARESRAGASLKLLRKEFPEVAAKRRLKDAAREPPARAAWIILAMRHGLEPESVEKFLIEARQFAQARSTLARPSTPSD